MSLFSKLFFILFKFSLHREALRQSAVDPTTGKVDVNILAAGMSATSRKMVQHVAEAVSGHLENSKGVSLSMKNLFATLKQTDKVCLPLFSSKHTI